MQNWRFTEGYYDIISKGISTVRSAITKLASNCIPIDLKSEPARDILRFLTNQYKPDELDEIEAAKKKYHSLYTPPTKSKVIDWIVDWECLRHEITVLKIGDISER